MSKQNKNYNKGKSANKSKGNRRPEKLEDNIGTTKPTNNDLSWYVKDQQLLLDTARIPFSYRSGLPLRSDRIMGNGTDNASDDYYVPGIATLSFIPSIGLIGEGDSSDHNGSALMIAAKDLYARVREVNSGAKNYEPINLMVYMLALDNAYAALKTAQRVYGLLGSYTYANAYIPETLGAAMGWNVPMLQKCASQFRALINIYASKLASFPLPQAFDLIARHAYLCEHVFLDRSSGRAQYYVFKPAALYRYTETSEDVLTTLTPHYGWPIDPETTAEDYMNSIADWLNGFLDPLLGSESVGIIAGDLRKAFGDSNDYPVFHISEDYVTKVAYDEIMLSQIHNSAVIDYTARNIKQKVDVNGGTYLVQLDSTSVPASKRVTKDAFLNCHFDNPTPADIMYMTRLRPIVYPNNNNLLSTGSEIITLVEIFAQARGSSADVKLLENNYINSDTDESAFDDLLSLLSYSNVFEMFPMIYAYKQVSGSGPVYSPCIFGDIDNYTTVDPAALHNIHQVALFGEYGVSYKSPLPIK